MRHVRRAGPVLAAHLGMGGEPGQDRVDRAGPRRSAEAADYWDPGARRRLHRHLVRRSTFDDRRGGDLLVRLRRLAPGFRGDARRGARPPPRSSGTRPGSGTSRCMGPVRARLDGHHGPPRRPGRVVRRSTDLSPTGSLPDQASARRSSSVSQARTDGQRTRYRAGPSDATTAGSGFDVSGTAARCRRRRAGRVDESPRALLTAADRQQRGCTARIDSATAPDSADPPHRTADARSTPTGERRAAARTLPDRPRRRQLSCRRRCCRRRPRPPR